MAKQDILDELAELLNIPQFERIIFHKVEELKLYFQDEIDRYRTLKDEFRRSAYGGMTVVGPGDDRPRVYMFELDRDGDGQWLPGLVEPAPPPGYDARDVIPTEIAEYIGGEATNPNRTRTRDGFSLPEPGGGKFDLQFIKYSDWHALGTITCYQGEGADKSQIEAQIEAQNLSEIYHYDDRDVEGGNFSELIYYMQKYPPLRRYFLTVLHVQIKPLILGKLVEISASSRSADQF